MQKLFEIPMPFAALLLDSASAKGEKYAKREDYEQKRCKLHAKSDEDAHIEDDKLSKQDGRKFFRFCGLALTLFEKDAL